MSTSTIEFKSNPYGAYVILNNQILVVTPFFTNKLQDGKYTFEIRRENFEMVHKSVFIDKNTRKSYIFDLVKNKSVESASQISNVSKKLKRVIFTTSPSNAYLFVDGSYIGRTPCSTELKEGFHKVEIRRVGYESVVKTVIVNAIDGQFFNFILE